MPDQATTEYGDRAKIAANEPLPVQPPSLETVPNPFSGDHINSGFYDEFFIDTIYKTDSGVRVIAKGGTGESTTLLNSLVRIHRGTSIKEIHWDTQRRNAKPKIPKWDTGDPNEIPLTQTMNLTNMAEGGGAGRIWRAQGIYTYALLKPKDKDSKYPVGSSPAEVAPSSARWYGPEDFSATILDAAFAAPSGVRLQTPIRVGS